MKLTEWLNSLFKTKPVKPAPVPTVVEPVAYKRILEKQVVVDMLKAEFVKLLGIKELSPNRSKTIDIIVDEFHGQHGEPYCAYTCSHVILQVCNKLEIDYPKSVYRGGSSQGFLKESSAQYVHHYPAAGMLMIQTNRDNSTLGHVGLCTSSLLPNGTFETIEANTDNQIKTRADRTMSGPLTKKVSGFVDVAQAIVDQWEAENIK